VTTADKDGAMQFDAPQKNAVRQEASGIDFGVSDV
jgi:hypothetical protein